ncbi:MAG: class I SAM-dependent methyltransferase [Dermatophilaceae bacterium]
MTEPSPNGTGRYTFDNSTHDAAQQVRLLAEILDGHTTDVLSRHGVNSGWACLDLGAGAGTIAAWLATQVGPTGRVVAADEDPRHIECHDLVDIRTADVTTMNLGDSEYDLIHARLLFMHLPQREELLRRAVAALRPGGLIVVSDWDCTRLDDMLLRGRAGLVDAFRTFQTTLVGVAAANGASASWAHTIPLAMDAAGLVEVHAETHNRVWAGGEAGCALHASNSHQMQTMLLSGGMTTEQLAVLRDGMADPNTLAWSYPMVTAVGRRPRH